jgi:hypothetical protein
VYKRFSRKPSTRERISTRLELTVLPTNSMAIGVSLGTVVITVTSGAGGACPEVACCFSATDNEVLARRNPAASITDTILESLGILISNPYLRSLKKLSYYATARKAGSNTMDSYHKLLLTASYYYLLNEPYINQAFASNSFKYRKTSKALPGTEAMPSCSPIPYTSSFTFSVSIILSPESFSTCHWLYP